LTWSPASTAAERSPRPGIGPLEADILPIVWEHKRVPVRNVYDPLRKQRQIAYATVMTVLNNLVEKGLLTVDRSDRTIIYRAAMAGDEVACTILDTVVARLFGAETNLAFSHLRGLNGELSPK
jgi:predicted transcriptional regulator